MPLKSNLFRGDVKLEAASRTPSAHIVQGASGDHVAKIQYAIARITGDHLAVDGTYGPKTAAAVLAFKKKWKIVNPAYQSQPDNIVGVMTIDALDTEILRMEKPVEKGTLARCSFKTS